MQLETNCWLPGSPPPTTIAQHGRVQWVITFGWERQSIRRMHPLAGARSQPAPDTGTEYCPPGETTPTRATAVHTNTVVFSSFVNREGSTFQFAICKKFTCAKSQLINVLDLSNRLPRSAIDIRFVIPLPRKKGYTGKMAFSRNFQTGKVYNLCAITWFVGAVPFEALTWWCARFTRLSRQHGGKRRITRWVSAYLLG